MYMQICIEIQIVSGFCRISGTFEARRRNIMNDYWDRLGQSAMIVVCGWILTGVDPSEVFAQRMPSFTNDFGAALISFPFIVSRLYSKWYICWRIPRRGTRGFRRTKLYQSCKRFLGVLLSRSPAGFICIF